MSEHRVGIVGGGAWGSALALHLAGCGYDVRLWIREAELVTRMLSHRDNPVYLPGFRFPSNVVPHNEMSVVLAGADMALAVVPSQFSREAYRGMRPHLAPSTPLVVATKGIEQQTLALALQVAEDELGRDRPRAILSGPSFANELARGRPTVLAVASGDREFASWIQQALSSRILRLYTNTDPVGVQLGGALKNVIAIAAGVADGLGMGANTRAALITRGLAEMSRLGKSLGANPSTFSGLAGLGDLVLTCTDDASRNRSLGRRLGRGERLEDILSASRSVVEGVCTTRSARELAERHKVRMPIVEEVHRILYGSGSPEEALERLMSRPLTSEEVHASESPE